jgi:AraC family transcriptional activator of mtrCDE
VPSLLVDAERGLRPSPIHVSRNGDFAPRWGENRDPTTNRVLGDAVGAEDLLSELLRPIRLTGVFHSWWHLSEPWSIEGDSESECVILHYVVEGSCWIKAKGAAPTLLQEGDIAIFPTGVAHRLSDRPERRGVPLEMLLSDRAPGGLNHFSLGGDGPTSRILCAGMHYDSSAASGLYRALPWVLVLNRHLVDSEPLLREVVDLLVGCRDVDGPGSGLITLRTFEMAFVLMLRPLLRGMLDRPDVMGAFKHPAISKALSIMYTRFAEPWTIESLAHEVGMSRSAFTATFRELVGDSPASHLTSCRMREAARLLTESDAPLSVLAEQVGYRSSVGLHLAFRKTFDMTPGEHRTRSAGVPSGVV